MRKSPRMSQKRSLLHGVVENSFLCYNIIAWGVTEQVGLLTRYTCSLGDRNAKVPDLHHRHRHVPGGRFGRSRPNGVAHRVGDEFPVRAAVELLARCGGMGGGLHDRLPSHRRKSKLISRNREQAHPAVARLRGSS